MTRRVFFSFHYKRDAWRAGIVRNSGVTKPNIEVSGYIDKAQWEQVERQGENAIKNWIDSQLKGTSITIVLIGAETYSRKWVLYEIEKSLQKGNGFVGIFIHRIKDQFGQIGYQGVLPPTNPLDVIQAQDQFGTNHPLSYFYKTYDWVINNGYEYLGNWVAEAARIAQK
jgi:hypothetical protein